MSIQTELTRLTNAKAAIQSAIEGKGVTVPSGTRLDGMAPLIDSIETGGGSVNPTATAKAVNFRDYDGTILYSYTVDEAAALTELPPLPEHSGLVCQGWNWTLDGIKAMGRAVEVGTMYITDDGKTRIYIHLEDGRTSPMLGCCPNGTVTVDWGDGTEPDTLTGTSTSTVQWTPTHEYSAPGDYVIKLTVDGSVGFAGSGSSNQYSYLLRYSSGSDGRNKVYQNAIQKVEIGDGVTSIGNEAFYNCYSLPSVTIPNGVTSIGNQAFRNCYSLSSVTIPNGVTSIGNQAFHSCYSLSSVTIPNGVTSINTQAFYNCYSLSSVTIPNGVTSIDNQAFYGCTLSSVVIPDGVTSINSKTFYNCYGIRYYDFTRHTTVPTLSNTDAFNGIAADCEIRVPAALADEWKAATNWATYANYIVGV